MQQQTSQAVSGVGGGRAPVRADVQRRAPCPQRKVCSNVQAHVTSCSPARPHARDIRPLAAAARRGAPCCLWRRRRRPALPRRHGCIMCCIARESSTSCCQAHRLDCRHVSGARRQRLRQLACCQQAQQQRRAAVRTGAIACWRWVWQRCWRGRRLGAGAACLHGMARQCVRASVRARVRVQTARPLTSTRRRPAASGPAQVKGCSCWRRHVEAPQLLAARSCCIACAAAGVQLLHY